MRRALPWWLALVAALGCGSTERRPPTPKSVRPDHGAFDRRNEVEILGHFTPVVRVSFAGPEDSLNADFQAELLPSVGGAPVALEEVRFDRDRLYAAVPAGLALGGYDLRVVGPDGMEGLLPSAYRSVTSAESVERFLLDAVGPCRAGVPFVVHATAIDATGRLIDGFDAPATITDRDGATVATGAFLRGRLSAEAVLASPTSGQVLVVSDLLGHRGESDPFDVLRGYPVAAALTPAPGPIEAGTCAGPFELVLRDASGQIPEIGASEVVALAADPAGPAFFADATCSTVITSLIPEPATAAASFHLRSTTAGTATLRFTPTSVPMLAQDLLVRPAAPHQLALLDGPRRAVAGKCHAGPRVELQDLYGNPSPSAGPLALQISITPPQGMSLFADAACSQPVSAPELAPGATSVAFSFQAVLGGHYELTVSAPGTSLLSASLTLQVPSL